MDAVEVSAPASSHQLSLVSVAKLLRVRETPSAFLASLEPRAAVRMWINNLVTQVPFLVGQDWVDLLSQCGRCHVHSAHVSLSQARADGRQSSNRPQQVFSVHPSQTCDLPSQCRACGDRCLDIPSTPT